MHKISIGKKQKDCPFYGQGSENCIHINNTAIPLLTLERTKKYKFKIECKDHKFVIASDLELKNNIIEAISEGEIIFEIKSDYFDHLYYGCLLHPHEGGPIEITSDDSVVLNIMNLKKIVRNPIAIKSFKQNIIVGLESGTFYICEQDKLTQIFGFKAILGKPVKLLDFTISNDRIYSLLAGHKDNKLSLLEVTDFDGKEEDFKLFDLISVDGNEGLLASDGNILYLTTDKTLYKLDVGTSSEYKVIEERSLDRVVKSITCFNKQLYLFNQEIIQDKPIHKLTFIPRCVEFIPTEKGYHLFYADENGNLAMAKGDEKGVEPGWKTTSLKGIKSILHHQKQMYILINNTENKMELWQVANY